MILRLAPEDALLKGFSNAGVATVGVLFVVAAGMYSTGAITIIADKLIGLPKTLSSAQWKILPPIAVGSAFLNNTPLVAMMIPVVRDITQAARLAASRLYMPLSAASILGGASTLIGTSTNLIIAGLVATAIADVLSILGGDNPYVALAVVFAGCIIMTNVITNAAAAAFMFPVSLSMANALGVNFLPFAVILMLGTSYAFINPAGYQTNMMVQGPGNYTFMDYVKVGLPLTIIVGIVAVLLAPIMYGF